MKDDTLKLSVVMVCFNAEQGIRGTLETVVSQRFTSYEIVIVDGGSRDDTLAIIREYENRFPRCTILSEPDEGIYDAMNKGVRLSKGEYIYFLNVGDRLFSEDTLKLFFSEVRKDQLDFYYGDMVYGDEEKTYPDQLSTLFFLTEQMICHQAIFAKRVLFQDNDFQREYRYCADRHWLYTVFKSRASYRHLHMVIGFYDTNGVSSDLKAFQKDSDQVVLKEFGIAGLCLVRIKRVIGKIWKKYKGILQTISVDCGGI